MDLQTFAYLGSISEEAKKAMDGTVGKPLLQVFKLQEAVTMGANKQAAVTIELLESYFEKMKEIAMQMNILVGQFEGLVLKSTVQAGLPSPMVSLEEEKAKVIAGMDPVQVQPIKLNTKDLVEMMKQEWIEHVPVEDVKFNPEQSKILEGAIKSLSEEVDGGGQAAP